tara:strand:- start:3768 stop:3959 length:192 start_codon:yes stop_codon:yes gene_type:complete
METQANGYRFVVNESGYVEAYNADAEESLSSLKPAFISNTVVKTKKDFEIEVSYIINDYLNEN